MNSTSVLHQQDTDGDTIGGRIFRARDVAGLSVTEISSQAGVRKETVAQWERDRSEPRANKLVMLAGILGVSPTWLMTGAGEGPTEYTPDNNAKAALQIAEIKRIQAELSKAINTLERQLVNAG